MTQQADGGRLAVGAGDTHQREFACRPAVKCRGRHCSGPTSIPHHHGGQPGGRRRGGVFHQRERRATRLGSGQPHVSILCGAFHGDERRSGRHAPTVVDHIGHGLRQVCGERHELPSLAQGVEQHRYADRLRGGTHLDDSMRGISNCTVLPTRSRVPAEGRVRTSDPRATLT